MEEGFEEMNGVCMRTRVAALEFWPPPPPGLARYRSSLIWRYGNCEEPPKYDVIMRIP